MVHPVRERQIKSFKVFPSITTLPSTLIRGLRAALLFFFGDKVHDGAFPHHPYEGFIHWMRGVRCFNIQLRITLASVLPLR